MKGLSLTALFLAISPGAGSENLNTKPANKAPKVISPSVKEHFTYATWYAGKFIGRMTAGGKRYNKDAMFVATQAHYPFGTMLRITNLRNHRSIVVPVEDREPYHRNYPGRTLDLSYAAAQKLDILSIGVIPVLYSRVR